MVKLKDTKLTADIDDQTEEYVTFWGKIKGNIAKQEDLMDLINSAKVSLSSSIESLRTWFKKELKNLKTSDLENDGDGTKLPDGTANPFITKDVTDALDSKIDSIEDDIMDSIYDSLVTDVTDNVTNNIADDITDIVVTAANEAVDVATKDVVDDITVAAKEDVESLIPVDVSELVNDAGYVTLTDLDNNHYVKESDLSSVATTGSYNDLTDKPVIPAAQVNSDWNATGGVAQILNKPVIPTTTEQLVNDSGFITLSSLSGYATESYVNNHHDSTKQDVLTAGNNITIENNVISATVPQYEAGSGISISNGVISNTQTSAEWGNVTGNISSQTDLKEALNGKQDLIDASNKLSASNISGLASVATSGSYGDLSNTPVIPTKVSDLSDGNDYATKDYVQSVASQSVTLEAGDGISISETSEGTTLISNTIDTGYSASSSRKILYEGDLVLNKDGYSSAILDSILDADESPNEIFVTVDGNEYEAEKRVYESTSGSVTYRYHPNDTTEIIIYQHQQDGEVDMEYSDKSVTQSGTIHLVIEYDDVDVKATDEFMEVIKEVTGYRINKSELYLLEAYHFNGSDYEHPEV